jgi:2-C-methyl-D-erythritol 4-phosphate cytidylyltransferase
MFSLTIGNMKYTAVIVAAGSGTRLGLGYNKAYYRMGDKTILERSMDLFLKDEDCEEIVVVTSAEDYYRETGSDTLGRIVLASGGETRQKSVWNGLKAVISDVVLIHDAARPFLSAECLAEIKKTMETDDAACLAVKCKDTIKLSEDGYFTRTLPREKLLSAQTPQAFRTSVLYEAMRLAERDGFQATDDCSVVERYGHVKIRAVEGSYENIKITTPEDIK